MAAPSNTKWGSIVGGKGRIGLSATVSSTNTTTKVHVEAWFWSKYGVSDTNNTYYYNNNATSATASHGSKTIKTTVSSGSGWSTSNQVLLGEADYSYTRGTSDVTRNCAAKLSGIDVVGGTMYVTASYKIPKLASYTVSYNANGGSGAPGSQTKWYGKNLTLSSTKPTRTGYTFLGWSTSSTATSATWGSGGTYTANASDVLYAVWKINTWTVTYDANGGTDAPEDQIKTYGQTLTLTSSVPTKTDYNFVGWATSADSTTVSYEAGGNYDNNANITLYAVWELAYVKPRLTNLTVDRCTSDGALADDGTYMKMEFDWASDMTINPSSSYAEWIDSKSSPESIGRYYFESITGTSGHVSVILGNNAVNTELAWKITIHIEDSNGYNDYYTSVPTAYFIIDIKSGGTGISFGEAANDDGFNVNMDAKFKKSFTTPWLITQSNGRPAFTDHVGLQNGIWLQAALASGAFSNILRMNPDGQVELNWTSGGMKGRVMKTLWEGTLSVGGKITISELPYYNVFIIYTDTSYVIGSLGLRSEDGASIFFSSALATGGANYQNLYSYAGWFSVLSSTSIQLNSFSRTQIYTDIIQKYPNITINRIVGVI